MSLLANLKRTANIEAATDYPMNARPKMSPGLHNMTIEMAYLGESSGGSISVTLKLVAATGATLDTTLYITSVREKGQKHYFIDKQTGAQKYLPSFTVVNDMARLTADQELFELEPEEKTVMVYNYDLKKDVPTTKQVLTELIGKEITVGVVGVLKDQFKDPTKFYTSFEIDKVFHTETGCTVVELESGLTEGVYIKSWAERNTPTEENSNLGIRDKREKSKEGAKTLTGNSTTTAPSSAPFSGGTPISSKFGKKV
jgi:hypothetical protein